MSPHLQICLWFLPDAKMHPAPPSALPLGLKGSHEVRFGPGMAARVPRTQACTPRRADEVMSGAGQLSYSTRGPQHAALAQQGPAKLL